MIDDTRICALNVIDSAVDCVVHRCLRQTLKETLRLTVISAFAARYSDDDIVVGGYHVPAGTPIVMALGVSLKSKKIWQDVEKYV